MLHLFFMDRGQLVRLENQLNFQSVTSLCEAVARKFDFPVDQQILLVSGGYCMDLNENVCHYGAGMDETNPIYVFNKACALDRYQPQPYLPAVDEGDLVLRIERGLTLGPSQRTITDRVSIALDAARVAEETARLVHRLVEQQSSLVRGWGVALANLAETGQMVAGRVGALRRVLDQFERAAPAVVGYLDRFPQLKSDLESIPLLPCLRRHNNTTTEGDQSGSSVHSEINLYQWICSRDEVGLTSEVSVTGTSSARGGRKPSVSAQDTDVTSLVDETRHLMGDLLMLGQGREQELPAVVAETMQELRGELDKVDSLLQLSQPPCEQTSMICSTASTSPVASNNPHTDPALYSRRLAFLAPKVDEANKYAAMVDIVRDCLVNDQRRLMTKLEISVLPDLCSNHTAQLNHLRDSYKKLRSVLDVCVSSKLQLVLNLADRQKWLHRYQAQLGVMDTVICHKLRSIATLLRNGNFLRQMETAPQVYARALVEIVRRREQNSLWSRWMAAVEPVGHREFVAESTQRRQFALMIRKHLLQSLFSSVTQGTLPNFKVGIMTVSTDVDLPALTHDDLNSLSRRTPLLAPHLVLEPVVSPDRIYACDVITKEADSDLPQRADVECQTEVPESLGALTCSLDGRPATGIAQCQTSCTDVAWDPQQILVPPDCGLGTVPISIPLPLRGGSSHLIRTQEGGDQSSFASSASALVVSAYQDPDTWEDQQFFSLDPDVTSLPCQQQQKEGDAQERLQGRRLESSFHTTRTNLSPAGSLVGASWGRQEEECDGVNDVSPPTDTNTKQRSSTCDIISTLQDELAKERQLNRRLRDVLLGVRAESAGLKLELSDVRAQSNACADAGKEGMTDCLGKLNLLQTLLTTVADEKCNLERSLALAQQETAEERAANDRVAEELATLRQDLSSAEERALSSCAAEVSALRQRLAEAESQVAEVRESKARDFEVFTAELLDLRRHAKGCEDRVEEAQEFKDRAIAEVYALQQKLTDTVASNLTDLTSLRQQLAELQESKDHDIEVHNANVLILSEQLASAQQQLEEIRAIDADRFMELTMLRQQVSSNEALADEIQRLQQRLTEVTSNLEQQQMETWELRGQLEQANTETKEARGALLSDEVELAESRAMQEEQGRELATLRAQLEHARSTPVTPTAVQPTILDPLVIGANCEPPQEPPLTPSNFQRQSVNEIPIVEADHLSNLQTTKLDQHSENLWTPLTSRSMMQDSSTSSRSFMPCGRTSRQIPFRLDNSVISRTGSGLPRAICFVRTSFRANDVVIFVPVQCGTGQQWRMLTAEMKLYFLHEEDFPGLGLRASTAAPDLQVPGATRLESSGSDSGSGLAACESEGDNIESSKCRRGSQSQPLPLSLAISSYHQPSCLQAVYLRKERCVSKKAGNRFNLPQNFEFYRVRARPITEEEEVQWNSPCRGV